jgi:hypothetical protein
MGCIIKEKKNGLQFPVHKSFPMHLFVFRQELTQLEREKAQLSAPLRSGRPKSTDSRNKHFSILLHRKNDEGGVGTYFIGLGFLM